MRRLTLVDVSMMLDGGTLDLTVVDEEDREHVVRLNQRTFLEETDAGELLFDDLPVAVRSIDEGELLSLLKAADVGGASETPPPSPGALILGEDIKSFLTRSPAGNLRATRDEIVAFVQSDEYVSLRQRLDRAQEIKE